MIDTRTFGEICKGLSQKEWSGLLLKIAAKTYKSPPTVYHWKNGDYAPDEITREKIVEVIKTELKIKTTTSTLFPAK